MVVEDFVIYQEFVGCVGYGCLWGWQGVVVGLYYWVLVVDGGWGGQGDFVVEGDVLEVCV